MSQRYKKSEEMLASAQKTIPLGSQTFSKSKTQFPEGVSPFFIRRGKGSHVWDVDGNEYVDFINSLAAVTIGYGDPSITAAVAAQLNDGPIFSLPHPLETEVAELIVEMVPCAEMVRFGKNGSDATSGAIRLARAYTRRDHVAVCGYHGWQDWYIGSTSRNRGVPSAVQQLTHTFAYNDIDSLQKIFTSHPGGVAAVILEPVNAVEPLNGFLQAVQDLTKKQGAVLIFDETITGFRFSNGGAQEYFGVTPDLATFGKGMANGYPVSAVVGRAEIMRLMEEIFFSFTFGGETLSLAAAKATLNKLKVEPVIGRLWEQGGKVIDGVRELIARHQLEEVVSISGYSCWSFLKFNNTAQYSQWQIKTLFLQEIFKRGILSVGTHNMSYSHDDGDIERLLNCYEEVFKLIAGAIAEKSVESKLECKVLEPLFSVR